MKTNYFILKVIFIEKVNIVNFLKYNVFYSFFGFLMLRLIFQNHYN